MSYLQHAAVATDPWVRQRAASAAAQEGDVDPFGWVARFAWNLPTPEWTDAWAAAEEANPGGQHGSDESVISDTMILDGVLSEKSRQNPQPWVQPSGAHDAYRKWFHVTHDDQVWRSTVAANVWEPGVSGWEPVG